MANSSGAYRYSRLDDSSSVQQSSSSDRFVSETLQKQKMILQDQDADLERVGDTVHSLKNISHRIGDELEEQSIMLDQLGNDMDRTNTKIESVTKKIARITNLNDDKRQCTAILVLSAVLFVLILLLIFL